MEIREYRKLTDKSRLFAAVYGMREADPNHGMTPNQFIAGHFAGLHTMTKEEFIRVMNGAGKALLREGIDCRTPAEMVRHQLRQIQAGAAEIV